MITPDQVRDFPWGFRFFVDKVTVGEAWMSLDVTLNEPQINLDVVNPNDHLIYEFHNFRLDADHLMLYRDDEEISLTPKQVETLLALVERNGEIVSKDVLMERLWGDTVVEEANLIQNIHFLRKRLGNAPNGEPMIETLRRRGYRFNAILKESNGTGSETFTPTDPTIGDLERPSNAYHAWQLSRYHFQLQLPPELVKARALLTEAVRLYPDFSPAYDALAELAALECITGMRPAMECISAARESLSHASMLDSGSPEHLAAAGFVEMVCDWNLSAAEKKLRDSLKLNPHYSFSNNYLGQVLAFQGRPDEAELYLLKSVEIEPSGMYNRMNLTMSLFLARDYERSIEECEKALAIYPRFIIACWFRCWALEHMGRADESLAEYKRILEEPFGEVSYRWIGYTYAVLGEREKALDAAAKMLPESRYRIVSLTHPAAIYAALGGTDQSISFLEQAYEEHDPWLLWLATDPRFDNLRPIQRFQDLVGRIQAKSSA